MTYTLLRLESHRKYGNMGNMETVTDKNVFSQQNPRTVRLCLSYFYKHFPLK